MEQILSFMKYLYKEYQTQQGIFFSFCLFVLK